MPDGAHSAGGGTVVGGMPSLKRFVVVTGHYGCGKTNLSINLALDLAATGEHDDVTLVDLDIVNPYFRSSDYTAELEARGIHVISPTFAGTTLDAPSLPAAIGSAFESRGAVVIDVGGDDAGATALGRYSDDIARLDYDLLYVVNRYRNLTATPAEAVDILSEIERVSRLKATGVVNNSHLKADTTLETVLDSLPYARQTAELLGLPLVCTTVPRRLLGGISGTPGASSSIENAYPIDIHVRTPWESAPGLD